MMETYLTPAVVVAATVFLWKVLGARIAGLDKRLDDMRQDMRSLGDRMDARIDRHLEGHQGSGLS